MKGKHTNSKKETIEQNKSLLGIPIEQIMELKLLGKSDREVSKAVGVAHSTVNKYYHMELQKLEQEARKNIENFRFQQYLRYENLIDRVFEQFNKLDFKSTQWATILTKLLSEQAKLYGVNTGNININLDQRSYNQQIEDDYVAEHGKTPNEALEGKINNYIESTVKWKLSLLLFGEPYPTANADRQMLEDILETEK